MTGSFSSLLILLIVIRSIQTQVCDFRSECGVVGGKTELFCAVTEETPLVADTNWSGPQGDLILGGLPETSNVDLRMTSYGFYLSILNTTESDVGSYTCGYLYTISSSCTLTKENLEALTCEEKVVDRRIVITITYRPYTDLPKIQVTDSDGNDINGTFNDGKHDDFLKEIVWTSDELSSSGGSYNYIVDGTCSLLMDCSGTVDIPGSSTSSPTTKIGTTDASVTPDMTTTGTATTTDIVTSASTTTGPAMTSSIVTNASTIAATTSINSLKIVYGVCGSLGGIIILVFIAILIYKTKKRNAGNRYTQSNLQHMNRRKDCSSNRCDNHGFADSTQDHRYNTQEPYNNHVSNHSAHMSPDYEQQDRDDHKYLGMSGKYAPYSTGGNHSDEPMDVTYSTGGNHTDEPLDVTYYTGKSQRY